MKISKFIIPLLMAGAFLSCQRYQPDKAIPLESVAWYAFKCMDADNEEILCPYSYIRLHKNKTFIAGALRGYSAGTWQKDTAAKVIFLMPDASSSQDERAKTLLQINYHSANYLNLIMARSEVDITNGNLQLLRMRPAIIQEGADPFLTSMQQWRSKPAKPESPDELKTRVVAYLTFLNNFYAFAANNKMDHPDTDWFPNVMKMDNPGMVRLSYTTELKDWYDCFYSEEQAVEGYKIISGPFTKITLKKMNDINERNHDVILQILDLIKG